MPPPNERAGEAALLVGLDVSGVRPGDPGAVPGLEFLLGDREAVSLGTWHLHRQFISSMNLAGRIQK